MKSKEEAIKALQELQDRHNRHRDAEEVHIEADEILCEVLDAHGLKEVADAYRAMRDHGVGFWYA